MCGFTQCSSSKSTKESEPQAHRPTRTNCLPAICATCSCCRAYFSVEVAFDLQADYRRARCLASYLHRTARYLRGRIKAVPNGNNNSVSDRRARQVHFDLYRQTRQNALALWCETVGGNHDDHPRRPCRPTSTPTPTGKHHPDFGAA